MLIQKFFQSLVTAFMFSQMYLTMFVTALDQADFELVSITSDNGLQTVRIENITDVSGTLDSTCFTAGAVGLAIWSNYFGKRALTAAFATCAEFDTKAIFATGTPCLEDLVAYASGLAACVGGAIYFTSQVLSGIGMATFNYFSNKGCEPGGQGCTRSDALSEHASHFEGLIQTYFPGVESEHRVQNIFYDDSEVLNGITMHIHHNGIQTAKVSHNETHHVIRILSQDNETANAKRAYLPTNGHYFKFGSGIVGVKAEGRHFNTPDNPPAFLTSLRAVLKTSVPYFQSDVIPYTVCSSYLHEKIYDGKIVFEDAPFGSNFERYETYACPPFDKGE